jgi:hypothetical protein
MDIQSIIKSISSNLGDLKQPQLDTQAIAKAVSGAMGDLKQPQLGPELSKVFTESFNKFSDIKQIQAMDPLAMTKAMSGAMGDLKQPPMDIQSIIKAISSNLGDLKQPPMDPAQAKAFAEGLGVNDKISQQPFDTQSMAKAISGNLGDLKQSPMDIPAIAKAISGNLGDLKQPAQMDPQAFAKIVASSVNDYRSVRPAGGELTQTIAPDSKMSDNLNSMKSVLDTFVDTKMTSLSESPKSVMPDFSKMLPINDIATSIAEKVNQQTANNDRTSPITPTTATMDNSQQLALMSQQLSKLDELVRVMTSQLDVSGKILAYQQ